LHLETMPRSTKIFTSYEDPDSHRLFESYGMRKPRSGSRAKLAGARLQFVPWAAIAADAIEISDPHRGHWRLSWKGRAGMMGPLQTKIVERGLAHVERG
ncbi:MAG: hypothetical protein V4760_16805, partial [Bdellovibrionota bacterium]